MRAVSGAPRVAATEINRPSGPEADQMVGDVLTDIAKALWPKKTAECLAAVTFDKDGEHPDPRSVERYMEGAREWSGDAVTAIISEILRRRQMRNVRVKARS